MFLSVKSTLLSDKTRVFHMRSALGHVKCTYNTARVGIFIVASDVIVAVRFPRRGMQARAEEVQGAKKGSFRGLRGLGRLDERFYRGPVSPRRLERIFSRVSGMIPARAKGLTKDVLTTFDFTLFCKKGL